MTNFIKPYLFLAQLLMPLIALSQHDCENINHEYLITKLPRFINSNYEESKPFLTQGSNQLFFVRSYYPKNLGGENAGEDIWMSEKGADGQWSVPTNQYGPLNDEENNIIAGIKEGKDLTIQLLSYNNGRKLRSIKLAKRVMHPSLDTVPIPHSWQGIQIPMHQYHDFYLHPSEKYLLMAIERYDGFGKEDLYVYLNNGTTWEGPIHLGSQVNSKSIEVAPFLTGDCSRLYFSSDRDGGQGGMDIWYADRLDDTWSNWTAPQNMGPAINSEFFDCYFYENNAGQAVFASNRNSTFADLYIAEQKPGELPPTMAQPKSYTNLVKHQNRAVNFFTYEVFFNHDQYIPAPEEKQLLIAYLNDLIDKQVISITITGHADATGSYGYNQELSVKRASNVAAILRSLSINSIKTDIKGLGEYAQKSDKLKALARKVVITGQYR
ncbi:OmpA family protein [Fulvivirgaceae bacterium BMA12]|uniref:OmpA family protein n=1 Tax=Agaribacillus aureus TaxID=3051825 RepID=A0ABT8L1W6_9BACT|nr:OmpA family protein [Fulvivirgaceae bacterium BMA12]